MKYSARLVTALAAVALLVAAIVALHGEFRTAQATHGGGPTHTDGQVYLTNTWSNLTTETPAPTGRTYVGAGKTLYATFLEQNASASTSNAIETNSNIVTIDILDADKNLKVATSSTFTLSSTTTAGQSISVQLPAGSDIVDRDGDGTVINDTGDIDITAQPAGATVFVSGLLEGTSGVNGGVVTLTVSSGTINPGATTTLGWSTSQVETLTALVRVSSTQDTTGITMSAQETGRNTGRFRATVTLVDVENPANSSTTTGGTTSATSGQIKIQNGGVVTVKYLDDTRTSSPSATTTAVEVTTTITAETAAPTVSVTGPTHNKATQERRPVFSGSVQDTASGIKKNTVVLYIDTTDDASNTTAVVVTSGASTPTLNSGSADGDQSMTFSFTPSTDIPTVTGGAAPSHKVDWQVTVSDMAGNKGFADSDNDANDNQSWSCSGTTCAPGEGTTPGRGAPFVVKIDQTVPAIISNGVFTGHFWNTATTTPTLGQNRATSIEVIFNDDLDPATVANTDFEVTIGGVAQTPTAAELFSGQPASVFLTLAAAMKANDKPVVKVSGQVSDTAGNTVAAGALSQTALDSLGPTLTVTLSGGSSIANPKTVTNDKMTITITSDEALQGDPIVEVWSSTTTQGASVAAINQGGNTWIATFTKTGQTAGKQSLVIKGTDNATAASRNAVSVAPSQSTLGSSDSAATGAIVFTLDTTAPTVSLQTASTDIRQPFVVLAFSEAVVSIQKATLGGVDISGTLSASADKKNYIHKPSADLAIGNHTVVVQGTDDAGNKSVETTLTLTITERKQFELPLNPGWNLVSLRGEPSDPSINSVITVAGVQTVIAYDPAATGGPWVVATRGADGKLVGSLTTMDASRGYWVNTTSFEPIKVTDPKPVGGSLPPSIPLRMGWNLVPARDVSGALLANATIATASAYFTGANVVRAYSFDTLAGTYSALTLSGTTPTNIVVGKGYWVYASAAGAILP